MSNSAVDVVRSYPEQSHTDPEENNMVLGNQFYGPTGANNDATSPVSGERLEDLVLNAPTSFSGGVPSVGQQAPSSGMGRNA